MTLTLWRDLLADMNKSQLLIDIEEFLAETGIGEFKFGILAVNNGRLMERLRKPGKRGKPGRVWPETEAQIRGFMISERRERSKSKVAA